MGSYFLNRVGQERAVSHSSERGIQSYLFLAHLCESGEGPWGSPLLPEG